MSESPQGPGWWQASDEKWYPPHLHPHAQPATQPTHPQQVAYPQQGYPAIPPATSSGRGCGVAVVSVVVVVVALMIAAVIAGRILVHRATTKVEGLVGSSTCEFLTNAQAAGVLGGDATVIQLGGITKIATPALDARVLPKAPTCWATGGTDG